MKVADDRQAEPPGTTGNDSDAQEPHWGKWTGFILGILLCALFLANPFGLPDKAAAVASVSALMACFWISLCLPIPVTSLLPIVLFPALGVMGSLQAVKYYADDNIYLFMGGFIIALGLEKWNFQKRAALRIVSLIGTSPKRVVLGFFCAAAALSMFISNTATAMMMLPIGLAIISQTTKMTGKRDSNFAFALLLAIAYGASIGGVATPIGTPPNIVFLGQFKQAFVEGPRITFFDWAVVFVPLSILFVFVAWFVVVKIVAPPVSGASAGRKVIKEELRLLGRMHSGELRVFIVFLATALLWIFRQPIDLGSIVIPGWSSIFSRPEFFSDATVAIAAAVALFVIPAGAQSRNVVDLPDQADSLEESSTARRGKFLMDWPTATRLPWGILLLFGGGFAIAGGFKESGLDVLLGTALRPLLQIHPVFVVAIVCTLLTFLTELTSNTATTAALLPVMVGTAHALGLNPLLLMIPATISASFAFMLPVGTPPNAIVFSSGHLPMGKMIRAGIILNLTGVLLVTVWIYLVALPFWDQPITSPAWATTTQVVP